MNPVDPANYTMKGNKPRSEITPPARVVVSDLTDDQLRKLAREKLSEALQTVDPRQQPEMTRKLCAELMDRLDGKPGQSVTMMGANGGELIPSVIRLELVRPDGMITVIDNDRISPTDS